MLLIKSDEPIETRIARTASRLIFIASSISFLRIPRLSSWNLRSDEVPERSLAQVVRQLPLRKTSGLFYGVVKYDFN